MKLSKSLPLLFIYFAAGVYSPLPKEGYLLEVAQKDRLRGPASRRLPSRNHRGGNREPPPVAPKPKGFQPPQRQGAEGGREEQVAERSHHGAREPRFHFPRAHVAPMGRGIPWSPRSHAVQKCRSAIEKHIELLEGTPVYVGVPQMCLWFSESQIYHVEVCVLERNPSVTNSDVRKFACMETDTPDVFTVEELDMQA